MDNFNPEHVELITLIAKQLAAKWVFPGQTVEDIVQQGVLVGLQGLSKYDGQRPLENFMRVHIHNRLANYKRDNYYRYEKTKDATQAAKWAERNKMRQALMSPIDITNVEHATPLPDNVVEDVAYKELTDKIRKELPVGLRTDFLRMLDRVNIPAIRRDKVREAVALIMGRDKVEEA